MMSLQPKFGPHLLLLAFGLARLTSTAALAFSPGYIFAHDAALDEAELLYLHFQIPLQCLDSGFCIPGLELVEVTEGLRGKCVRKFVGRLRGAICHGGRQMKTHLVMVARQRKAPLDHIVQLAYRSLLVTANDSTE